MRGSALLAAFLVVPALLAGSIVLAAKPVPPRAPAVPCDRFAPLVYLEYAYEWAYGGDAASDTARPILRGRLLRRPAPGWYRLDLGVYNPSWEGYTGRIELHLALPVAVEGRSQAWTPWPAAAGRGYSTSFEQIAPRRGGLPREALFLRFPASGPYTLVYWVRRGGETIETGVLPVMIGAVDLGGPSPQR